MMSTSGIGVCSRPSVSLVTPVFDCLFLFYALNAGKSVVNHEE